MPLLRDDGQYADPSFGGPEQVLKYLARYTHRVAISNHRLVKIEDDKVFFHYKDYADDHTTKIMSLDAVEFIRRFLQHVVPSGFMRIRHFGFLAHRCRADKLKLCRQLIQSTATSSPTPSEVSAPETVAELPAERHRCPDCGSGRMIIVTRLQRSSILAIHCASIASDEDTS